MTEERHPGVMAIETYEEFLQRVEAVGSKMRVLSGVTILVALLLAATYVSQLLVVPFLLGVTTQTVNLVDPTLIAFESGLLILALVWLYVGVRDYQFMTKLARQIREIRSVQSDLAKRIGGSGEGSA